MGKKKVLVVGGGMGALATAFQFTRERMREHYDVTVYQEGWLLGGKCSSGRDPERGMRNEEHGLHMLMGFYDNTFSLLREAYIDWNRHPGAEPEATLNEFFQGRDHAVFYERVNGAWDPWAFTFPVKSEDFPGKNPSPTVHDALCRSMELLHDGLHDGSLDRLGIVRAHVPDKLVDAVLGLVDLASGNLRVALEFILERTVPRSWYPLIISRLARHMQQDLEDDPHGMVKTPRWLRFVEAVTWMLQQFGEWLGEIIDHLLPFDLARRIVILADLATAVARGFLGDEVWGSEGYNAINRYDFIAWLQRWGSRYANSAPVLAVYGAAFAYSDGIDRQPVFAAGVALQASLRLFFGYSGHLMYDTKVGMGEAIFVPLYEVMRDRGVNFEFFHHLTRVVVRDGKIVRLHFAQQAKVKSGTYQPLIEGPHANLRCWPSHPHYDQLEEGEALQNHDPPPKIHCIWPFPPSTLPEQIVEVDADTKVVLGMPPAALAQLVFENETSTDGTWQPPRVKQAIETSQSVHTIGVQLYFNCTMSDLGWGHPPSTCGSYAAPLDTFADMSQLLPTGGYTTSSDGTVKVPQGLLYLCGVRPRYEEPVPPPPPDQVHEIIRMREMTRTWLASNFGTLFPKGTEFANPAGIDWTMLFDWKPEIPHPGTTLLNVQYLAANIAETDRYVQSPPASIRLRLMPGETGVSNMVVSGDWVLNQMSAGALESAVVGGMLAAQAIEIGAAPVDWPVWPTPMK